MIIERILNIMVAFAALFLLWIGLSWVDVVSDNLEPEPRHSKYNFFVVLTTTWEDSI